jgi:MFS family permease
MPTVMPDQPLPLHRNRDYLLLWTSQALSTLGTRVSGLAYPLLVLALTGSPAKAGLVGFAQTLPFLLLYLPAGALVDRWDRKRVMLAADAVRAVGLASVALALAAGRLTFAQVLLVAFVDGSLFVFFQLAESAALPHVVHSSQISAAVAQNQAREHAAELAGQPLGGVLFGLSPLLPFAADAVTYALSFGGLLLVRPAFQQQRPERRGNLLAEIGEGVRWLWRRRLLRTLVAAIGAANVVFNALPLVLIVRAQQLGASPALVGVMFAFYGAGGVVGALLAPRVQRHVPARRILTGSLWLWALQIAVLAAMPNPVALGIAAGTTGLTGPAFNVVAAGYRYALAPDRLQARTQSAARLVAWGSIPFGALLGGVLAQRLGTVTSLLVLAGLMLAVALAATAARSVRNAPQVESLHPDEPAGGRIEPPLAVASPPGSAPPGPTPRT